MSTEIVCFQYFPEFAVWLNSCIMHIFLAPYTISAWSVNILCTVHFMHLWIWLKMFTVPDYKWSWDSSVMGYGLDGLCLIPGSAWFFSSPQGTDKFRGPPSLPSNEYCGLFPGGKMTGAWSWPLTSI
jgi:hypothetical protein